MLIKQGVIVLVLVLMTGCGMSEDIKEAESVMNRIFRERIRTNDQGPVRYYSHYFLEATGEKEWDNMKRLVTKAHGALLSYEQQTWELKTQAHTSELSGTFVAYTYLTTFENGQAKETITLFKNSDNPEFRILGHRINSENIQQLLNNNIEKIIQDD